MDDTLVAEVEQRLAMLLRRFPNRFDPESRDRLRRQLTPLVAALRALQTFPLADGEPDFTFHPGGERR